MSSLWNNGCLSNSSSCKYVISKAVVPEIQSICLNCQRMLRVLIFIVQRTFYTFNASPYREGSRLTPFFFLLLLLRTFWSFFSNLQESGNNSWVLHRGLLFLQNTNLGYRVNQKRDTYKYLWPEEISRS